MRKVKVAAIQPTINDGDYRSNLDATIRLLERAGSEGCDIVTTSEDVCVNTYYATDVDAVDKFKALVETTEPLIVESFGKIAKKYSMYIIGAYIAKRSGVYYNLASVFDRNGNITGEYRKTHLPANETWLITPGNEINVFKLDFGTIGISICYDMMFPESVRTLALKRAEIIFHPTFGYGWYEEIGEMALRVRANDYGVYIVTSVPCSGQRRPGRSSIIDHWGYVLDDALYKTNTIVTAEIDLDAQKTQGDWYINGVITGYIDVSERMKAERRPELYDAVCDTSIERVKVRNPEEQQKISQWLKEEKVRWDEVYRHHIDKIVDELKFENTIKY